MISFKAIITGLSIICVLAASPPYIIDTVRGKTRPERATWFIFTVLGLIAIISQLAAGATWSVVFTIIDSAAGAVIFGLSFWHGAAGWTRRDKIALIIAGIGVVGALLLEDPVYSILGVILADGSGMALTLRKAFLEPESETSISWLLSGVGGFLAILIVNRFSFAQVVYPLYLGLANCAVVVCQYAGTRYNKT